MRTPFNIKMARTNKERQQIFLFRYQVYITEMGKSPAGADHENKLFRDELDDSARLLYAEADGQLVGTVRFNYRGTRRFPAFWEQRYKIDRFAADFGDHITMTSRMMVAKAWRGSRVSAALVGAAYKAGRGMGSRFDFCNCAPGLIDFYEQIGFRRFVAGFVDEDNGYRVPLVLLVRDVEHLKRVRSPLYRVVRSLEHEPETGEWFRKTFPSYATAVYARPFRPDEFWAQLHDQLAVAPAACVPLFEDMSDDEVSTFLRSGAVLTLQPGDKIIRQGDVGDEMYVILSGVAEATGSKGHQEYSLAIMDKGQVFGEVAFVSKTVRSADVTALTRMKVLVISKGFLMRAMRKQPELTAKVLLNLSLILAKRLSARTDSWLDAMNGQAEVDGVASVDSLPLFNNGNQGTTDA